MSYLDQCLTYIGVTLPKEVYIQNHRLGFVLLFMRLLVFCFWLSAYVVDQSNWSERDVPTSVTTMRFLAFPTYDVDAAAEPQEARWCTDATAADYSYADDAGYEYNNYICQKLPLNERWVKGEGEIYIPTMFEQTYTDQRNVDLPPGGTCASACDGRGQCPDIGARTSGNQRYEPVMNGDAPAMNAAGQCLCLCEAKQDIFPTGIRGMQLEFHHQARSSMAEPPPGQTNAPEGSRFIFGDSKAKDDEPYQVRTIVDKPDGSRKVFEPGEAIIVTMAELLGDWGRLPNGLGTNFLDHDYVHTANDIWAYPYRVTGMDVEIVLNYQYPAIEKEDMPEDMPVCRIQVILTPKWLSRLSTVYEIPEDAHGQTRFKFRYQYGMRLHFSVTGQFTRVSTMRVLSLFADLIVYMQVPMFIMMLMSRYSLGQLSEIYYKAQVQILDIGSEFYGLISRALVAKQAYDSFLKLQPPEWRVASVKTSALDGEGLHPTSVKQHLKSMLESFEDLQDNEITIIQRVLMSGLDPKCCGKVTRQSFVEMCTNDDETNLGDLAKIFDMDRKPCCLETIFDSNKGQRDAMGASRQWEEEEFSPRNDQDDQDQEVEVAESLIAVAPTAGTEAEPAGNRSAKSVGFQDDARGKAEAAEGVAVDKS